MVETLSIGVVGAGVFGGYHAAKCAAHPRVRLSGIHDRNTERARALGARHGVEAMDLDALIARSDALVIACSAVGHADAALPALAAGRHVLIEKPIAHTVPLARAVVDAAANAGVVLQVGHQERFVAGVIGLDRVAERPIAIRAWRRTPAGERGTDVSVTLDLMTHDIDLVLWLMGADPVSVEGRTSGQRGPNADTAHATLIFDGATAELEASRIAETPARGMEITYPSGVVAIDFNAKTLTHDTPFALDADFGARAQAADSLGAGTDAFVAAVLDGAPIAITGGNGLRALQIAARIDADGRTRR